MEGKKNPAPGTFASLTVEERQHLRHVGCRTLWHFKAIAADQLRMRMNGATEPCYDCKNIARKLGLPV